jgi:hypothetical protein
MTFCRATRLLLPIAVLVAGPTEGQAQELVALDAGGGFWRIDERSGLTTSIGSTGVHGELWTSLAQDSSGRLFSSYGYWNHPFEIHEIDPLTGHASFVLQTNFIGVSAMAFGPGDVLYLTENPGGTISLDYELHQVDLATGVTTMVGSTGVRGIVTLDFDDDDRLWAFPHEGLVELDLLTGAATDVNPTFQGPPDPTKSMVFGEDDTLWMIDLGVWIGDRTTGVPSLVAPMSLFSIFSGLEYIPGPTPPFSLWTTGETGGPMGVRAVGATPGGTVVILMTRGGGGPTAIPSGQPCAGTLLDLNASMRPLRVLPADAQGRVQIGPMYVPTSVAPTTHLQAVDITTCKTSNHARIIF